jgi:putrescine transport system permease protein
MKKSGVRFDMIKHRQFYQWIAEIPYLWLLIFVMLPVIFVIKMSFSESILSVPPVSSLTQWVQKNNSLFVELHLNLQNYIEILTDVFYIKSILTSCVMAITVTLCSLILGYLMAYGIYRSSERIQILLLLFIIIPFWTSFLIRIYAWMNFLGQSGPLNTFLLYFQIIKTPLAILDSYVAAFIGIVYCYLSFMILPIYTSLSKMSPVYIEAAFDLGCSPWKTFWRVTVPLSKPGILSGCCLVFIPSLGEFLIPELLGGSRTAMIGRVLWDTFFHDHNWPMSCAIAVVIFSLFILPLLILNFRKQSSEDLL